MANRKISDLTALTAPATGDLLPIVDISEAAAADKNKKITIQSLFQGIPVNVGIGTTSPDANLVVQGSSGAYAKITDGTVSTFIQARSADSIGVVGTLSNHGLGLWTNSGEKARIDSSGRLLVGTSTSIYDARLTCQSVAGSTASVFLTDTASEYSTALLNTATSGNNGFALFQTEATPVTRGSITYNRAGGVVAYNITSDYRAKTLLGALENPGETIDALKVYRGVMNGATIERPMLIAHEAQEVAPYCVTGEKDAVDDDGNPIYQQMDHQVLVPLLIAEIQQLRARVVALEAA